MNRLLLCRVPRHVLCHALVAMWGLSSAVTAAGQGALPPDANAALARAQVPPTALSVLVTEVGQTTPRLSWQAEVPRNPASLMKLYTTYAGLSLLGPTHVWRTPVWIRGTVRQPGPDGVLEGDVHLQGRGDPKLVMERVWLLLKRVQQWGIRDIRGDIVIDRQRPRGGPQLPRPPSMTIPAAPTTCGPDAHAAQFQGAHRCRLRPDPSAGRGLGQSSEPSAGRTGDVATQRAPGWHPRGLAAITGVPR